MRNAFIDALHEAAEADERVWLVCGDLGYSVLEPFAARFPDRFLNAGVAEQNMTGVAAGLALSGKIVFTYSIANFPVMRCLEQIRNDVCYHDLNVNIVAVGGGLAYGPAGYTHHAVEDLAVMRAMPNMTVVAPGDPVETRLATRALARAGGPSYLRLGKAGEPVVHLEEPPFRLGRAISVRDGTDATIVSTGAALRLAVEAADALAARDVSAAVLSMPTVKPLDEAAVLRAAAATRLVCVVQEHSDCGGLTDAVARCLATRPELGATMVPIELAAGGADGTIGSQEFMAERAGVSAARIGDELVQRLRASAGVALKS